MWICQAIAVNATMAFFSYRRGRRPRRPGGSGNRYALMIGKYGPQQRDVREAVPYGVLRKSQEILKKCKY